MNTIPKKPPMTQKLQSKWKIEAESSLAHSKAFGFVIEQFSNVLKQGLADNEIPFTNTSQVLYVVDNGIVVGATAWVIDKARRTAWMLFSAVAENYKKQGIYKALTAEVERRAKNQGAIALYSGVHVDNEPMITAAINSGRNANWYRTKKDL